MTRDAKFIVVGRRLAGLRQAYIALAAGQRRSWPVFYDRLEQLIDAASEAARIAAVDAEALNAVCQHAVDGLRIYGRRTTIGSAELRIEIGRMARTLMAFWQL